MNEILLLKLACLTGFVGDLLLQVIVKKTKYNWGLRDYFKQHGSLESAFIACGMLSLFYVVYLSLKLPVTWYYLGLYGVILDLIFRLLVHNGIFASLKGYYSSLNYFWSAVWGFIPMAIPVLISGMIN